MTTKNKPKDKMRKLAPKKSRGASLQVRAAAGAVLGSFMRTSPGSRVLPPGIGVRRESKLDIPDDRLSYSESDQHHWRKRMNELTFGQSIRAYRMAEDWSLTDTAEKIGISKQQLSDYELGRKLPSIEQADRIAKALDMMPEGLVLQVINEQLGRAELSMKVKLAS